MKKLFLISSLALVFFTNKLIAQDIRQNQVPSLIVNNFQKTFPKAFDVEWELEGENYKVEFETGLLGKDYNVWYNKRGKLIRYKKEIAKSELPQKVQAKINSDFKTYRIDDLEEIFQGNNITYKVELKSISQDWKVVFDNSGNVLSKQVD